MNQQEDHLPTRRSWLLAVKAGSWAMGVTAAVGLVADVKSLIGIPRAAPAVFALSVGALITALGSMLYGREWNKPLRWHATKAVGIVVAGVALVSASVVNLLPDTTGGAQRKSGPQDAAEPLGGTPKTLREGYVVNLDPSELGGSPDVLMGFAVGGMELRAPEQDGVIVGSLFASVSQPSASACADATGWTDRIKPFAGDLICVKTDLDRYVVLEVLSATTTLVTYKIVYESAAPTP